MKHRVDSDKGKWVYSHRLSTVEPVFGNIGTNKGLNRFSLRGKGKVQEQYPKRFTGQALAVVLHGSQYREDHELRCNRVDHRDIHRQATGYRTIRNYVKGIEQNMNRYKRYLCTAKQHQLQSVVLRLRYKS